ncbi:hypothetical protein QAC_1 [Pseudomonas phage QAC]|uniref:Uncharacterized protein n=2 Tax=Ghunavirus 17A TaxID=2733618 RepID=A0AAE7VK19_9CAUD|nr:hypothetical protein FRS_1 [Pseudomonas phage FRS]UAV89825.1 hypothetical protein QAC_1 [Pseudomonas phage QAC]
MPLKFVPSTANTELIATVSGLGLKGLIKMACRIDTRTYKGQ